MADENNPTVTTETVTDAVERNFSEETPKDIDVASEEEEEEETDLKQVEGVRLSHFQRSDIHSPYVRFGFPCFLLCTLALLIVSEFSNGIDMKAYLKTTLIDPFTGQLVIDREDYPDFRMNMYTLTKDFWDDGAYFMSIMTCLFSVIWPFLKLFSLFAFWFYPFDAKHPKKAYMDYYIQTVEQCGKWSLLEVYMLIIYIVIFSYTSHTNGLMTQNQIFVQDQLAFELPDNNMVIASATYMDVLWGMAGFIMASSLALLGSHFLIHKHRQVIYPAKNSVDEIEVSFAKKEGYNVYLIAGFMSLTNALVITGFFFKTVQVDYIESTNTNFTYNEESEEFDKDLGAYTYKYVLTTNPVSTFDILESSSTFGINFSALSENPTSFATKFVQFVYFNLAIVFPIINHISTLLFCIAPLKRKMRVFLYTISVSSSAWCGYGVNIIALIMILIDQNKINDSINDDCQSLCNNLDISFTGYAALFFLGYAFHLVVNFAVTWYGYKHLYGEN